MGRMAVEQEARGESFEEFKNSFYYGSRTDLAFKFLKSLPEPEAARFFQSLLTKLGESIDDGDVDRLVAHAYEWQVRGYAPQQGSRRVVYDTGPFVPLRRPLREARVALFTSSGHFVAGNDPRPFGVIEMSQEEAIARINEFLRAAPKLACIPADTPASKLRVRHGGYDIRAAGRDPNVIFPLDRLRELAVEGVIGELAPNAYAFAGATAQTRLVTESGPEWAGMLRSEGVDAVLLVAA